MKMYRIFSLALLISFIFAGTALAGVPMIVGDYVWFDENGNGLQDDGAENGINGVRVIFYRDYECNGVIDGNDEIYDYDYTANDEYGNPGYYYIPAVSSFCFVAFLDFDYVPAGLISSPPEELSVVALPDYDYFEVDFGLKDPTTTPQPEFACPKTIGFWKQQFKQEHSAKYSQEELNLIVETALELTDVFDDYEDIEDALLMDGHGYHHGRGCHGGHGRHGHGKCGSCHHGRNSMQDKAEQQFAALLLNLAAYDVIGQIGFPAGLNEDTELFLYYIDADTVGEAFGQIEWSIVNSTWLEWAKSAADMINNGWGIELDCEL